MSISVLARKYNAIHDIKLIFSKNPFRYLTGKLAIISSNVYIFLKDKKANDNTYRHSQWGKLLAGVQTEKDQLANAHQILAFVIGCSWRGKCWPVDVAAVCSQSMHGIMKSL